MRCEDRRQTLSMLLDGALEAADSTGLFAHLESCQDCRAFFETLLAARGALRRDQEQALREADDFLPVRPPRPAHQGAHRVVGGWSWSRERPWSAFAAALALAALLVVAGIAIGTNLPRRTAPPPGSSPSVETEAPAGADPTVVYMCSLPEYQVLAKPLPASGR